jgi:MFS family permease
LITMATYGVGMWIGTLLSGYVKDYYTVDKISNWKSIWMVPAGIAFVVLIFFVLLFKDKKTTGSP